MIQGWLIQEYAVPLEWRKTGTIRFIGFADNIGKHTGRVIRPGFCEWDQDFEFIVTPDVTDGDGVLVGDQHGIISAVTDTHTRLGWRSGFRLPAAIVGTMALVLRTGDDRLPDLFQFHQTVLAEQRKQTAEEYSHHQRRDDGLYFSEPGEHGEGLRLTLTGQGIEDRTFAGRALAGAFIHQMLQGLAHALQHFYLRLDVL